MKPLFTRPLTAAVSMAAVIGLAIVFGLSGPANAAEAKKMTDAERAGIEAVIKDYIKKHPEIVVQAIEQWRADEKRREKETQARAVKENFEAITRAPGSPVGGNPDGDVTLVEFFDYRCSYCRRVMPAMLDAVKEDGKVRIVFKEFPILSPQSRLGARAALAAARQNKYMEFHTALMSIEATITESVVVALAKSMKMDADKLVKDMKSPEVKAEIEANYALAQKLKIRGTPAFVIGTTLIPGAIDKDEIKKLIAEARANQG